jgi:HEAT repeat protein
MRPTPAGSDFDGWVKQLAVSSRRQRARRHLLATGPRAVPAIRAGLHHPEPMVRRMCARILDQLVDEDTLPDLVAALDDEDVGVLRLALHSLACDRCKQGECRPGEELFVPRALEFLHHPDADVRAAAIDALGNVADHRPDVADALADAGHHDADPGLRAMARRLAHRAGTVGV